MLTVESFCMNIINLIIMHIKSNFGNQLLERYIYISLCLDAHVREKGYSVIPTEFAKRKQRKECKEK